MAKSWFVNRGTAIRISSVWMICFLTAGPSRADETSGPWQAGFSRVDITPAEPLRLSGYGNRDKPFEGVDGPLYVRGFALRAGNDGPMHVLISVDTIGLPGDVTRDIHGLVKDKHGLERAQVAVSCSHSHTSPHINRGLTNIFSTPLSEAERTAGDRYSETVIQRAVEAVDKAIADLKPARLFHSVGEANFAVNRRVLKEGKWTGFGVNPNGPVDHALPCLRITDPSGEKTRGVLFNYACHCTTFGGEYNRVNADWAGYAAKYLEEANPGATALCTIGCGADANPQRDSARAFEISQAQGHEIADEINRLFKEKMTEIRPAADKPLISNFGYAGLPIERPTADQLKEALMNSRPQVRRHAENMLAIQQRMGRLPETYPMPIQSWRFGDQFAMVFLGGEVCVDYATRVKREFAADETTPKPLPLPVWVTAYANDVFAYVASERMRDEGGYEVDYSMIYYNQPGRWASGTEDVILRRVHELVEDTSSQDRALSLEESLKTFTLAEGLVIEPVASEPLLSDPVNFSIGPDGRLWVVEMGDYPRGERHAAAKVGNPGKPTPWDGPPAGRIKVLSDTDGDGAFDSARIFLDQLRFPTGVFPWRDGVLISMAPDVIFARDTNGDGTADEQEVLYSGFEEANPQHRINGFAWGLDGWLYLASGASSGEIICHRTGETVNMSGRDIKIHPASGRLEPVSGRSQYGRCRDDWGNWFGNTNSEPLFHFAIEDQDLRRNPFVASPSPRVFLTERAAQVYPTSRTVDRFNDLFALDRFTSACSPHIFRDDTLDQQETAVLICEPVHNLVSRVRIVTEGVTFRGERFASEQKSEFLSSTDQWFRPVKTLTGPDGCLWVCDMYRQVIEHPQWIPEAWQAQLDLYAGSDRGRIYRVRSQDHSPRPIRDLTKLSSLELVALIDSPNGWQRDVAQQLLLERGERDAETIAGALAELTKEGHDPRARVQAWWTLAGLGLHANSAERILRAKEPEVVSNGVKAWGLKPLKGSQWQPAMLASHPDVRVRYAVALAVGDEPAESRRAVLAGIAKTDYVDPWQRAAILSSSVGVAEELLTDVLQGVDDSPERSLLIGGLVATALGDDIDAGLERTLAAILPQSASERIQPWMLDAAAACLDALQRRNLNLAKVIDRSPPARRSILERLNSIFAHARTTAARGRDSAGDGAREIASAVRLLGRDGNRGGQSDLDLLESLLAPHVHPEVQAAAVETLAGVGGTDVLLAHFRELAPARRTQTLTALLTRKPATENLLDKLETGEVPLVELDAATRQALENYRDRTVRDRARKLLSTEKASPRGEVVASYLAEIMKGKISTDAVRGRALFEKRCATCHKHDGIGTDLGPKLSALQNKSTEFLIAAVLDPNQAVESKYSGYVVETTDGRVHSGLIAEENATSLILAAADGKQTTLLRREINALSGTGKSFMPEGLEKDLSPAELADVVAFVQHGK